ncbi:chorismate-binding protein [Nakamurella deserti]|uniref:chorismate-binding protein n=1 Tax=Nakamurella deserti TaxID=2164074 RepID=UPI000DBE312A|nr:chorismate-binding protein [Nakamurella deserti]
MTGRAWAHFGGRWATDLVEVVDLVGDPAALDRGGWWAVLATFEGRLTGYRFATVRTAPLPVVSGWRGPAPDSWRSSLDADGYVARVGVIRRLVEAGQVYQVNLCRMLDAPLPPGADPAALAGVLAAGNPAPYQGVLHTGDDWVVCASPELFLAADADRLTSAPIKGTAAAGEPFAAKDTAENVMITDLVRNDLNRVCTSDSVRVDALLATESHPGLVHLVSTVSGRRRPGVGWGEILAATFPPGSVSGAPKLAALEVIAELEPVPRGPYCGAVGFVDADRGRAELAVGIRSFFTTTDDDGSRRLRFGTGAGITHPSDPYAEWRETELKAARLIGLASAPAGEVRVTPGLENITA